MLPDEVTCVHIAPCKLLVHLRNLATELFTGIQEDKVSSEDIQRLPIAHGASEEDSIHTRFLYIRDMSIRNMRLKLGKN